MGNVRVYRRIPYEEEQERGLVSTLGAVARCDPRKVAESYLRNEGAQAYVVAKRDGVSAEVLRRIRSELRQRRQS